MSNDELDNAAELVEERTAQDIEADEALWQRVDAGELEVTFLRNVAGLSDTGYVNTVKKIANNHYMLFFRVEGSWSSELRLGVTADFELWVQTPRIAIPALRCEVTGKPPIYFRDTESLRQHLWVFLGEEDEWREEWAGGKTFTVSRVVMTHKELLDTGEDL